MAGQACERGKVLVDEAPARASRQLVPGSVVRFDFGSGLLEIEVLALPAGNVSRAGAADYYRVVRDERNSRPFF